MNEITIIVEKLGNSGLFVAYAEGTDPNSGVAGKNEAIAIGLFMIHLDFINSLPATIKGIIHR